MKYDEEIWGDIPNLKGYQASNFGNIRSLNYNKTGVVKNLSKYNASVGYEGVKITINGIGRRYLVHKLVVWTFYGVNNNLEINHKDGNKKNNKISNLEYCTRSQNVKHAYDTGLKKAKSGGLHPKAREVLQFKNGVFIKKYDCIHDAERNGYSHSKIVMCCQHKRQKHCGCEWRYANEL